MIILLLKKGPMAQCIAVLKERFTANTCESNAVDCADKYESCWMCKTDKLIYGKCSKAGTIKKHTKNVVRYVYSFYSLIKGAL